MSYGGGEQDQALHLAKAQTRVSVPHQLSSFSHICELGRVGVAQTLLSVLVRLGTPEAMNASAGCRDLFFPTADTVLTYRFAATVSDGRFCASPIILKKSWR